MTQTPWWWCTWQNKNKSSPTSSNSQTSLLKFNCCSVLYSNPAYIDLPSQLDLEVAILCTTSCQTFPLDSDQEGCLPLPVPPAHVILLFHLPRSSSCPTCRVPCSTNTLAHKINPLPWLPTSCSPSPVSLSLSWSTTPPSQPLSLKSNHRSNLLQSGDEYPAPHITLPRVCSCQEVIFLVWILRSMKEEQVADSLGEFAQELIEKLPHHLH